MRCVLLIFLAMLFPVSAVAAQHVTIKGKIFYLDGRPWLPKGLKIEAFARPAYIPSAPKWMNDPSNLQGRAWWTPQELTAMKIRFGATVVRFAVSQPALDPQSPIYDPNYLSELLGVFRQARDAGFVVIPSMDAQGENGILDLPCMPNDSAVRAWRTLAPRLANDPGVMLELFDEPCKWNKPETRTEWARETQAIIDAVRTAGARNILLVQGLFWARQTNGLFPLLHDPLPNRLALAVHPYLVKDIFVNESQWQAAFGVDAANYPMIATEWNAVDGCVGDDLPGIALAEVRYLQRLHIGLIGWAIDSDHGRLVKDHDHFEPIGYNAFHGCVPTPKGQRTPIPDWGGGRLLANFPNN
ncbi:MAG: cellulase family glycosylhydrolase [Steroidobacteraceae bacterium]